MKVITVITAKLEAQRFIEAVERLEFTYTQEGSPMFADVSDTYPKSKHLSSVKRAALELKLALIELRSRS